ncbi:UNVERIFIED_CONTAM: hypothetical protein Slati_0868200 [Sesamum latifolium]|uniref:Uncharacterized protein n=1 Tax=Sesamum latifolium TaxID=2727402 RepID=A0AAW2XMN4_9LAMI
MMSPCIAKERGIERGSARNSSLIKVLQRSRRLPKDKMILRLGDGKAIAAEAVGSVELAISHYDKEVGGLKKSRNRRFGQPVNLQILSEGKDDQETLYWTKYASQWSVGFDPYRCLWTLNTQKRGGYSYFITFTDDHSRYDYVYLMRYKSEAFGTFKEYRLEFENQTSRKIKVLRLDRCGEYLNVFLKKDFPSDSRYDEIFLEESSEVSHETLEMASAPSSLIVFQSSVGSWPKAYTQRPEVDFRETYSPVEMAKSIHILLAITAWYDYEIWKMDVKIAFSTVL